MIVDGKTLAEEMKIALRQQARCKNLKIAEIWVGDNPVSAKYVARKKKFGEEIGVEVILHELANYISQADLAEEMNKLVNDEKVNGIIVQLPLPSGIDEQKILDLIPPGKDVDALGHEARVLSPTVEAIKEILERNNVSLVGKKVVVLGRGKLVGRPVSVWLAQEGVDVQVVDINTENPEAILRQADIIISGVGKLGLITPDRIREGVVLVDVGTSESAGQLKGDADPACADKCSLFTPVPGGVGPLTVAMLFKNLLELNS